MAITAKMVSELRSRTGAGIMECKKALTETNGDIRRSNSEITGARLESFRTQRQPGRQKRD